MTKYIVSFEYTLEIEAENRDEAKDLFVEQVEGMDIRDQVLVQELD